MIETVKILRAEGLYPYRNQAIERYLLETCGKNEMILYLWANDNTVFIGKNQNAYTECRLAALRAAGGYLARRFTGGGAVYHDRGNLNFTFLSDREHYESVDRFGILLEAVRSLGIPAELNGRNDVIADGRKFSGNAFYRSEKTCLHHGTLLISSDPEKIGKFLSVSRVKLQAKGVQSVRSRVANLSEFRPGLGPEEVASALESAFLKKSPGAERVFLREADLDGDRIEALTEKFSDERYLLGDDAEYGVRFEARFSWGTADIRLDCNGDRIERARIYSDSLDPDGVESRERLLTGLDLKGPIPPQIKDIIDMLGEIKE